MIALLVAGLLGAPPAMGSEEHLDAALRCARRADFACAATEAALAADSPDLAVARDARAVLATALARTGKPTEAQAAFERLFEIYPQWRPPPDADPSVVAAFDSARRARLRRLLPTELDAGPAPDVPRPTGAEVLELLPQPRLYSPPISQEPPSFAISIGAGVGVPSSDRVGVGLHAALDFHWLASERLSLWIQGAFALLPLDDELPVEAGQARGLTVFGVTAGVELDVPLDGALSAVLALGVGYGGFGYREPAEASGLALAGVIGVRWQADNNLALRLDAAPLIIVPIGSEASAGSHFAALLRGETRF